MLWSAQWSYFECTVCAVLHVVTEKHMNFIFLFINPQGLIFAAQIFIKFLTACELVGRLSKISIFIINSGP